MVGGRLCAAAMSSSDDEVPLAARMAVGAAGAKRAATAAALDDSSDDDDVPLAARVAAVLKGAARPAAKRPATASRGARVADSSSEEEESESEEEESEEESDDSSSEDDVPLAKRMAKPPSASAVGVGTAKRKRDGGGAAGGAKKKKPAVSRAPAEKKSSTKKPMWATLEHHGVLFPPEYVPHGIKMRYDGAEVELTPDQEEIATMYAQMLETDYVQKAQFNANFWRDWSKVLGKQHVIQSLAKCDFKPIFAWHVAEREKKKAMSKEEKAAAKAKKEAEEAKFKVCLVDGKPQPVGNFRVEPPGLFRGRGEHPKMGCLKRRMGPRDITLNLSRKKNDGSMQTPPVCPIEGAKWGAVIENNTATWLATWDDPVLKGGTKYVYLAANSDFKAESDIAKYEKARKLKDHVDEVRGEYWRRIEACKDDQSTQVGVAAYFIDKFAFRAGGEKDTEEEADTVGCCNLKAEHVRLDEGKQITFDFLGKDSIRYFNEVEVDERVHRALAAFKRTRKEGDNLFEAMTVDDLNAFLRDFMPGLSAKVFRTYNASITLDSQLQSTTAEMTLDQKVADYNRANKAVAILCNHQKTVSKGHGAQMDKMKGKLDDINKEAKAARVDLKAVKAGTYVKKEGKKMPGEEQLKKKIATLAERKRKLELQMEVKEDLKTVALTTSKINYLDPRITVSWCKKWDVPIEKVFNRSLYVKHHWAMTVEPTYRF